jgi:hypothetical protein
MSYTGHFAEYTLPTQFSFAAALAGDGSMPAAAATTYSHLFQGSAHGIGDMNQLFDDSSTDVDQTKYSYPDHESLGVPPNIPVPFIMYIH